MQVRLVRAPAELQTAAAVQHLCTPRRRNAAVTVVRKQPHTATTSRPRALQNAPHSRKRARCRAPRATRRARTGSPSPPPPAEQTERPPSPLRVKRHNHCLLRRLVPDDQPYHHRLSRRAHGRTAPASGTHGPYSLHSHSGKLNAPGKPSPGWLQRMPTTQRPRGQSSSAAQWRLLLLAALHVD